VLEEPGMHHKLKAINSVMPANRYVAGLWMRDVPSRQTGMRTRWLTLTEMEWRVRLQDFNPNGEGRAPKRARLDAAKKLKGVGGRCVAALV
jgi:hypothetical protein